MGMYMPPYVKKKGAYGADQTEKVGAFRAEWYGIKEMQTLEKEIFVSISIHLLCQGSGMSFCTFV